MIANVCSNTSKYYSLIKYNPILQLFTRVLDLTGDILFKQTTLGQVFNPGKGLIPASIVTSLLT